MNLNKTMVGLLVLSMTCMAMASGCSEKVKIVTDPIPIETEQESGNATGTTPDGETGNLSAPAVNGVPYDGQVVRNGQSYAFTGGKIAFLAEELNELESEITVELVATVTPADAKQDVKWEAVFVTPDSTWAKGKNVSDYITITPINSTGTTVNVTCKKGFSEQIKIICTSLYNEEISDECLVDFIKDMEQVSLKLGECVVNLGGITDVTWEVCRETQGWGGEASVEVFTETTGTLTGYTWTLDFVSPKAFEKGVVELRYTAYHEMEGWEYSYQQYMAEEYYDGVWYNWSNPLLPGLVDYNCGLEDEKLIINGYDHHLNTLSHITRFELDNDFFIGTAPERGPDYIKYPSMLNYMVNLQDAGSGYMYNRYMHSDEELKDFANNAEISEGSLYTLVLTVKTASGRTLQYLSLINLTAFTYTVPVQSVEISKDLIQVPYYEQ